MEKKERKEVYGEGKEEAERNRKTKKKAWRRGKKEKEFMPLKLEMVSEL